MKIPSISRTALLTALAALWICAQPAAAEPASEDLEFFERKIRPILVDVCQKCHGASRQESGLRLDSRAAALKGGEQGPALEIDRPEQSRLWAAVQYEGDLKMPPRGKLPQEQLAAFAEWIERGAPWPADRLTPAAGGDFDLAARKSQQWALQPIQPQAPPEVQHAQWVWNPVDRFLVAALEQKKLAPAPLADKRTLLRRVTFDLTGLPPTPEEIAAFLADDSPKAYEEVVDRLLDSPRYGERWARHWLDLVRYAETSGHEFDFEIPYAFEYRDYVIRALNADVPYNQFVEEHIAGDLLPEPRRHPRELFNESIIGTGFWFLGESKHSPVDIRVDAAERLDNQIDVFSKAFLAQTVACARCHDHKFDAISTHDYHALCGFIQSSRMQVADSDPPFARQQLAAAAAQMEHQIFAGLKRELDHLTAADLVKLLLAAQDVLRSPLSDAETVADDTTGDVVFADFEGTSYDGWTSTGEAFGVGPNRIPLPEYQGDVGGIGKGLVNSHSAVQPGGGRRATDEMTGTLRSKQFVILHPYLHFLVGGGAHAGKTCVNLKVNNAIARTATGRNSNRMDWATFDVREFDGKLAELEIVDAETGGWGNIGVDQILFSNSPVPGNLGLQIRKASQTHDVEEQLLARWVHHLQAIARDGGDDPLQLWAQWISRPGKPAVDDWQVFQRESRSQLETASKQKNEAAGQFTRFADFRSGFDGWSVTGEAFGWQPACAPFLPAEGLPAGWPRGSVGLPLAHSGRFLSRLHGTLRSPSFEIPRSRIQYRLAGKAARLRLVIDQFQQIRYPIYGGLEFRLAASDKLEWHVQEVEKWVGHTAYIELLDEGDGYAVLEQVLFSDQATPPPASANPVSERLVSQGGHARPEEFARDLATLIAQSVRHWNTGEFPPETPETQPALPVVLDPATASVLNWVVQQGTASEGLLRQSVKDPGGWSKQLARLQARRQDLERNVVYEKKVLALADGTPQNERIHPRGNPNKFGDVVSRRLLESLGGAEGPEYAPGSGRLELARRLVDPANPLVSRVVVNRLWKHHFGEGLVRTTDDFGNMGQSPTHPELLDWLSAELIRRGWSLKQMHRLMVTSRAYALSSTPADPAADEADPLNLLLHRAPLRRLEAETIRDAILAVSGRLDLKEFGPSVMPHLTPFMIGRGRPGNSGPLDGDGRRSIYIGLRRNFLNPMFQAFDAPVPFSTIGRRSVSNVPAQALAMMNNPFVIQQAELWAKKTLRQTADDSERIRQMYEAAYSRLPDAAELREAREFLAGQQASYPPDEPDRAWADLAHVLFNVKEFVWIP